MEENILSGDLKWVKTIQKHSKKGVHGTKGEGNYMRCIIFIHVSSSHSLDLCVEREKKFIRKKLINHVKVM